MYIIWKYHIKKRPHWVFIAKTNKPQQNKLIKHPIKNKMKNHKILKEIVSFSWLSIIIAADETNIAKI